MSVDCQFSIALPRATDIGADWLPREDVPVVINSYNRLKCLEELVSWLVRAGQRRLYIVDNASEYRPLLGYLNELEARQVATVLRLKENAGHLAIWSQGILDRFGIASEYVYTDPDVIPADNCPLDVIGYLQSVLKENARIAVAGLGLRLDDLPDGYRFKAQAINWENQFWLAPAAPGLLLAPIDTTFALYRPGSGHCLGRPSVRTGWPWVAAHRGWYSDETSLTEEDLFYRRTAGRGTSNWSVPTLPGWLSSGAGVQARRQPCLVQVTPPGMPMPGYLAASAMGEIDLPSASADGIYVAGQLAGHPRLQSELRRVVKANGRMVVHLGRLEAGAVREMLRPESEWIRGWRLRRAVIATQASAGASWRAPVDALMLHFEPGSAPVGESRPELEIDRVDYWPGFAAAPA